MFRLTCIAVSAALLIAADVSQMSQLRQGTSDSRQQIPASESIPVLPSFASPADQPRTGPQETQPQPGAQQPDSRDRGDKLTEESRIEIIREVSGEFASMIAPLPSDKKGFHIMAGEPLDRSALQDAVRSTGAGVNAGDKVQITKIDFGEREIKFEINGGPNGHTSWRDRVKLTMGGPDDPVPTGPTVQAMCRSLLLPAGRRCISSSRGQFPTFPPLTSRNIFRWCLIFQVSARPLSNGPILCLPIFARPWSKSAPRWGWIAKKLPPRWAAPTKRSASSRPMEARRKTGFMGIRQRPHSSVLRAIKSPESLHISI